MNLLPSVGLLKSKLRQISYRFLFLEATKRYDAIRSLLMTFFRFLFFLTVICASFTSALAQDTLRSFKMVSGNKVKKFHSDLFFTIEEDVVINQQAKTKALTGHFMFICRDTIYIQPTFETQDVKGSVFKIYSENTDSLKYAPISEINRIVYDRKISSVSAASFWLFSATALVASPILSIKRNGFDTQKFFRISGISLGGAAVCLGITAVFGERSLEIKPSTGKKRIWKFQY